MKSVLISIQPKWCELIASGKKTVEVRKTRPKIDVPFKVYIYCTQTKTMGDFILCKSVENAKLFGFNTAKGINKGFAKKGDIQLKGKVIGEFICRNIYFLDESDLFGGMDEISNSVIEEYSCVSIDELLAYKGSKKEIYGWHISNLVIYDKPKELSEFRTFCTEWEKEYFTNKCLHCKYYFSNCADMRHECTVEGEKPLVRPPQSWCYVEKGGDEE